MHHGTSARERQRDDASDGKFFAKRPLTQQHCRIGAGCIDAAAERRRGHPRRRNSL